MSPWIERLMCVLFGISSPAPVVDTPPLFQPAIVEIGIRLPDFEPWFVGNVATQEIQEGEPIPPGWVVLPPYDKSVPGASAVIEALKRAEVAHE